MDSLTIEQVVSVISASAVLIAYIIGEGMVDAARVRTGEAEPTQTQAMGFSLDNRGGEYDADN